LELYERILQESPQLTKRPQLSYQLSALKSKGVQGTEMSPQCPSMDLLILLRFMKVLICARHYAKCQEYKDETNSPCHQVAQSIERKTVIGVNLEIVRVEAVFIKYYFEVPTLKLSLQLSIVCSIRNKVTHPAFGSWTNRIVPRSLT
jgi:hypothetical protein